MTGVENIVTADVELVEAELVRKAELVKIVDRTIASFVECGEALAAIRDEKLYRDEHSTFEEFVEARWNLTARRARQLIDAAGIVGELPSGTAVPVSERAVRELAPLRDEPELMAKAIADAEDIGTVSSTTIRQAVSRLQTELHKRVESAKPPRAPRPERRRRPITDQADDAVRDVERAVERLNRITADDRFVANRRRLAELIEGRVTHAINELLDVQTELRAVPQ